MKERKKERKIKKRRRWVFIKFFYLFALIPSLLIFIKSHTKQLNKRWASIPIKKRKKKIEKEREKKEEDGHLSNSSTLLICSRPVFAHFHQIPYKTVRQKMGTYQILLCCLFALVLSLLVHLHIRWH